VIQVDGSTAYPEQILVAGQTLTYHRPPWEEPSVPLNFSILYADEDVIAIAKPAGLPVLPGGGFLEHTLLHQLQRRFPEVTPCPVHRLGRGTSGVVLLARSPLAKRDLSRQWRESTQASVTQASGDRLLKTYRALIRASNLSDTFVLTTPIGLVPYPVLGKVYAASPTGKPAYSEGRVLRRTSQSTLVEVTIQTGRPHQIRIHLAAAGFPLLHDPFYAAGGLPYLVTDADCKLPVPGDCGYWLHAYRLQFRHPRTGSPLDIVCPPPIPLR
jgi:23S rRNA pseudouridine1911/1915/1917 synthase